MSNDSSQVGKLVRGRFVNMEALGVVFSEYSHTFGGVKMFYYTIYWFMGDGVVFSGYTPKDVARLANAATNKKG